MGRIMLAKQAVLRPVETEIPRNLILKYKGNKAKQRQLKNRFIKQELVGYNR